MIRKACEGDLGAILDIVADVLEDMRRAQNPQWGADYPTRADFERDLEAGELYVFDSETHGVLGMVCVNLDEPPAYGELTWAVTGPAGHGPVVVAHRLAVAPRAQGRGVGAALLGLAEEVARENGLRAVRSDTYCKNAAMNGLFLRCGYTPRGQIRFPGRPEPFICYDKAW